MGGCIGVIDTTFARVDMAKYVLKVLQTELPDYRIIRYTVPGIKDLPGAAKRVLDMGCDAVITLGWVGAKEVDKYSYLAMSIGLIMVSILTNKIVIDVTVHEDESEDPRELERIAISRAEAHAKNLALLLRGGLEALTKWAGMGKRQGYPDVGPLRP
jgi:riboflavin synthase